MRSLKPLITILCVVALGGWALSLHDYLTRKRAYAERTACVGSLNQIRMTKLLHAHDHGLPDGTVISDEIIWREIGVAVRCHSGGQYSINPTGVNPSCSHTGAVRWCGRMWRHGLPE